MTLRSLNIAPRSGLFFSAILMIVIALGAVAVIQMGKLRDSEQDVETNWMASMRLAGLMNSGALRLRLETLRAATTVDLQLLQQTLGSLPGYRKAFFDAVKMYESGVAGDEERGLYDNVRNSSNDYGNLLDKLESFLKTGDREAAATLINTMIRPATDTLQDRIAALREFNDRGAKNAGVIASQTYSTGLTWVFSLIAIAVISTILLAFFLVRSITAPIGDALKIADKIAQKDLSEKITIIGQDEASRMLTSLAQMQGNLRQTVGHIADSSTQMASASEEMTVVIEEASRGLVRQNDEVNQAATAVTEMSAAVDEVARNAATASDVSQHTRTLANAGLEHVSRTLVAIQQLAENVGATSEQVQTLASRAQDISKVVEVIRSIAEQTNLLALNAAIEAARAGEQGRGFAVVADEVRALAHRTQVSTQEIEQMISVIQNESLQAVQAMGQSQKMAGDSSIVAEGANGSLKEIADAVLTINERSMLIATAAEEQAHVAREIDRNLTSIRDLSTQSAAGSSQTALASSEVSKLAASLNTVVREFVI